MTAKLRAVMPRLTPADLPTARAWCELEVLARLVFAELRTNGFTTATGEPRRLLAEYRQLRTAQLAFAREMAMTPAVRASLKLKDRMDFDLAGYIAKHYPEDDAGKPQPPVEPAPAPEPDHDLGRYIAEHYPDDDKR
jgi:hypothetical protein